MLIRSVMVALSAFILFFNVSARADEFQVIPLGWLDMDMSEKVINQGTAESGALGVSFTADDPHAGYRELRSFSLQVKEGVYGGWMLDNSTFASSFWGAGVFIFPVEGSTVIANRSISCPCSAEHAPDLMVPAHAKALADWQPHDSIYYDVSGGLIFAAGVGYAFTGLSGDYYVQGDWITYVEKLDATRVFVKITNVSMNDFDLVAGNFLVHETLSSFNKADKMFSYILDVSDPRGAAAYEAMIHGSLKEVQDLANQDPSVAKLDATETGGSYGHESIFMIGIPFLYDSETSGKTFNFSDTVYAGDGSKADVEFGYYWNEDHTNVFGHHMGNSQSFAGVAVKTTHADGGSGANRFGRIVLSYEDDQSDSGTLKDALKDMIKRTGLRQPLQIVGGAPSDDLDYTHLSLTVVFSDTATQALLSGGSATLGGISTDDVVRAYFAAGDTEKLCTSDEDPDSCEERVRYSTHHAYENMKGALASMASAADDKAFASAYRDFGGSALTNEFTFALAVQAAQGGSVTATFQAEGTKISKVSKQFELGSRSSTLAALR